MSMHVRLLVLVVAILLNTASLLLAQKWETLANIPEKLTYPVVTVLDGKIYVMGGGGAGGASTSNYRYNPATETWDTLASIPYKAQQPAGAACKGLIHYFGGGYPNSGTPLDKHYIYDPATNTWKAGASLTKKKAIAYGVSVGNRLYCLAGQGSETVCQYYNDTTNAWITLNPLPDTKFWYGAHIVANDKIYRFCGGGYTSPVNTVNEYDPANDTWTTLEAFPESVHGIDGAAVGEKIYLFGGYYNKIECADGWIYDTKTQSYFLGIPLPATRSYHRVVSIGNDIYCVGGTSSLDENAASSLLRVRLKGGSTDVNTTDNQLSLQLYPQPADSHIRITAPGLISNAVVRIVDVLGNKLLEQEFSSVNSWVSIATLSNGLYRVDLTTGSHTISTPLVIAR